MGVNLPKISSSSNRLGVQKQTFRLFDIKNNVRREQLLIMVLMYSAAFAVFFQISVYLRLSAASIPALEPIRKPRNEALKEKTTNFVIPAKAGIYPG